MFQGSYSGGIAVLFTVQGSYSLSSGCSTGGGVVLLLRLGIELLLKLCLDGWFVSLTSLNASSPGALGSETVVIVMMGCHDVMVMIMISQ